MKIHLDCLPCTLRQALEASRMSTDNVELQKKIISKAIGLLNQYQSFSNPPELGREIHRIVKAETGNTDPYYQIKQQDLQAALNIYPKLKQFLESKKDCLYWALKAAALGNSLDSAVFCGYDIEKEKAR